MGAMSNDPAKLAHFTGLYKSIQSAGGAVAWRIDAIKIRECCVDGDLPICSDIPRHRLAAYMNIFISTWVLLAVGLICALPMLHLRVKDHTELEEETVARMDDSGRVRDVSEVKAVLEKTEGTAHSPEKTA